MQPHRRLGVGRRQARDFGLRQRRSRRPRGRRACGSPPAGSCRTARGRNDRRRRTRCRAASSRGRSSPRRAARPERVLDHRPPRPGEADVVAVGARERGARAGEPRRALFGEEAREPQRPCAAGRGRRSAPGPCPPGGRPLATSGQAALVAATSAAASERACESARAVAIRSSRCRRRSAVLEAAPEPQPPAASAAPVASSAAALRELPARISGVYSAPAWPVAPACSLTLVTRSRSTTKISASFLGIFGGEPCAP